MSQAGKGFLYCSPISGGQVAVTSQFLSSPGRLEQVVGIGAGKWCQSKGYIFEAFHFYPSGTEHHQRTELSVLNGTEDDILPIRKHALDMDALEVSLGTSLAGAGDDLLKPLPDCLLIKQTKQDTVHIGFVGNIWAECSAAR